MQSAEILYGGSLVTLLIGILSVLLYWNFVKTYDFWKKRKVPFVRPTPFVGSAIDYVIKSIQETELQRYKKLGRIYGHFEGTQPLLSVGDPALLKNILVKDFQVFPSSRLPNINDELVSKMLANAKGEDWKRIRSIISPTFSSGKIKKLRTINDELVSKMLANAKGEDWKRIRSIISPTFSSGKIKKLRTINDELVSKMLANAKGEDWKRIRSIISPTFSSGKIKKLRTINDELVSKMLANAKGEDWKRIRSIISPTFSSGKIKKLRTINDELVSKMLANAKGEDWKRIRSIISPTFSSGKIKKVMDIMKDCSRTAVENFRAETKNESPVNTKRIYGAFTMDLIASAAFSTKIDSHNDPDNEFASTAKKAFRRDFTWKNLVLLVCPQLRTLLRIPGFQPFAFNFFYGVSLEIIEERKKTGERGNDFLQLLMDTAKELSEDPNSEFKEKDNEDIAVYGGVSTDHQVFKNVSKKHLSVTEVIAQCITFFFAGYESVSTALSMATYMLALHPEVQEKVYADLVKAVKEDNGELTYDGLQSVKYLDNIISETLRLFPPILRTEREAVADYKLGDTGITLPKGTVITVPIYAMHRDPDFFPDPEKFDPDRFSAEERSKRDPYTYLPFGAGPRNCVAMRFALVEIKVPMEYFKGVGLLQPKDVTVALEEREEIPFANES